MKSSATNAAFALLVAAAALGAAVFACTTTSSTNTDTDGGGGTSSGSTGNPTPTPTPTPRPATCDSKQDASFPISSTQCQRCLNAHCCSELKTCFALNAAVDCNEYSDCISGCTTTYPDGGTPLDDCYKGCDNAA